MQIDDMATAAQRIHYVPQGVGLHAIHLARMRALLIMVRMTIGDAIAGHARTAGDSLALVGCASRSVTFKQLLASVSAVGDDLAAAGLGAGDRVGLLVPPGLFGGQLVVALASHVTLVPMNPSLTPHEIVDFVTVASLAALVIPRSLDTPARAAMLAHQIAVLDVAADPDGGPRLQVLKPRRGAATGRRAPTDTDAALLLRSSGTTGAPKLILVTHRNLVAMAGKLASEQWFHLTAQDRVPCTLQLYYAAGLKTSLLVPLILGASVGFPPSGQALDLAKWIDELRPTFLSVAPGSLNGILDRLKASSRDFKAGSLRFVMCAAAHLPEHVRLAAESVLNVPVLEFYGLSEAGVMAANPAPPGKRKPGTVGLPAAGELLLVDDRGQPVPQGAVGQIAVSGPTVTPGYLAADGRKAGDPHEGWLRTGDLGRLDEDGYLSLVGRVKEVINRGGEKVFPYEIEQAISQHPAVLEAAAFGVPHPRLGEGVAAAVILKHNAAATEQELKDFLAGRLAAFKLPRSVHFVPTLPRGDTGKVLRRALTETYATARGAPAEPYYLIEFELRDIWQRLLGTASFGIDDDFFEVGGDSLLATEMLLEVERLTGRPYPQSDLSSLTIRRISSVVQSDLPSAGGSATRVKSGNGIPLFFCHGDYLTRGIYAHKLAAVLPDNQPVFLLHCPMERSRGSSIEEMASTYLEEVLGAAPPRSPVFVGGYCNGGLAAWHLAHLLRLRGVEVVQVLLVETLSLNARPGMRALSRLVEAAASMARGRAATYLSERSMRLAWVWSRRFARLASLEYGAQTLLSTRRAPNSLDQRYLSSMSRYLPPPIDVEVTCFVAERGRTFDTRARFWRRLCRKLMEVRVRGTHHTAVVSEREALAAALSQVMNQAAARHRANAEAGGRVEHEQMAAGTWPISARRERI